MTPSLLPRGPLFQGIGERRGGRDRLRHRRVRRLAGALHALEGDQPAAPRWAWLVLVVVGIIGQVLAIIWFHVWQDDVRDFMGVPRLGFWDHPLTAVLSLRLPVRLRRDRPAGRQIGAFPGPPAGSRRAAAGFGGGRRRPAARADRRAAQRRRGAGRDGRAQQVLRLGQRRARSRQPRSDQRSALGRPAVAGQLGLARPPGPHLRRRRADRGAALGVQRRQGNRADPRLRRTELRRRHQGDRQAGRRRNSSAPAGWTARSSPSPPRPAPAGSTRPRRRRWSTCTTATPRSCRCSTRSCPAGSRSWSTRRTHGRPGQALFEAVDALVRDDARGQAAEAGGVRREPGLVRRRDAVPVAEQPASPAPTARCSPARRSTTRSGPT